MFATQSERGDYLKFKHSQTLLMITVVLFIGYLPKMITSYYDTVQNENVMIKVPESIAVCNEGSSSCYKDYKFQLPNRPDQTALAIGIIFSASIWKCDGKTFFSTGDPLNISLSRVTHNEYFIIEPQSFRLCKSNMISARVYFPITQKKSGIMAESVVLTNMANASKLKSAQEFVYKDYKVLNLCSMVFILLFTFFIQIVSLDVNSKARLRISALLLAGGLAQSCILEVFFPFSWMTNINRWVGMLAYCGYLSVSLSYLSTDKRREKFQHLMLFVLTAMLIISKDRVTSWIWFSFFSSIVLAAVSIKDKNFKLFVLSLLTLSTSFEFVGFSSVPNSYIVPTFLAILIFSENQRAFSSFLKINRLLKLNTKRKLKKLTGSDQSHSTEAIVKWFQKQFRVERITILNIIDTDTIHLQRFSPNKSKAESVQLEELPPVFAHVVTTGNALINVHAESKLVEDIRRRDSRLAIDADFFTVLPLYSGREVVGAIALTKYSPEQFKTSLSHSTFMFCLDMLKSLLVEHLLTTPKTASLEKITQINKDISEIDESNWKTTEDIIQTYGKVINNAFGWRIACFGQPDDNYLLKHLGCYSFDPEVEERFINGKIYAHKDNQQGPLAIAVHSKKIVIVPNTKWLEGVVHQLTTKFFGIHKTKTAAFVPVFGEDETTVIGVYWIEGINNNEITYADREMFSSINTSISEKIKYLKSKKQLRVSHESLSKFIPEHLVEAYLNGEDVQESDHGFLLMFDLKGSTRLSHALGNDTFHKEVDSFKDLLVSELEEEWVLRQFVWDGFEFTKSSNEKESESINIQKWTTAIENKFNDWKLELSQRYGESLEIAGLSFRVVFTFGDVSRGVVEEGATRKWTLKGSAVAVATKVEQASKELEGKVFCDYTIINRTDESWVHLKTTSQGIDVYGLNVSKTIKKAA